jgi:hypothetical protein
VLGSASRARGRGHFGSQFPEILSHHQRIA